MTRTDNESIGLYHGYLNSLHAYMQGYYTRLNIWQQLAPDEELPALLKDAQEALDHLIQMYQGLWNGQLLDMKSDESPQVSFLDALLKGALYFYDTAPESVLQLVVRPPKQCSQRDAGKLIGFYASQVYGREHFVKGLIGYGENFNLPDVADRWRQHLLSCQSDINDANTFFVHAKEEKSDLLKLMIKLQSRTLLTPGIFRCRAADLRHLEAMRRNNLSYEALQLPVEDGSKWKAAGFDPLKAAYWDAYGFTPNTATEWLQGGFSEPGWAAGYRLRGIDLSNAVSWSSKGINATKAAALEAQGAKASEYVQQ